MTWSGFSVQLPPWLGGIAGPAGVSESKFGLAELFLTSLAVGIIFAILMPRWLRDRRQSRTEDPTAP